MASTATLHTNHGDIIIDLFEDQAPKTVANFVGLANGTQEYADPKTGERTTGNFYDGKRAAAQYFFRYELPKVTTQLDLLASLDRTTVEAQVDWF